MGLKDGIKKFWKFVWYDDSVISYIIFFILAFIFLKISYPVAITGMHAVVGVNDIVSIVSGSMIHDSTTQFTHYDYLQNIGYSSEEINSFPYNNGLNMGDLMFVHDIKSGDIRVGDIVVFYDYTGNMIIHRVIQISESGGEYFYTTKGDHNNGSMPSENNITYGRIKGVARNRVPLLGIPKMLLTRFILAVKDVL